MRSAVKYGSDVAVITKIGVVPLSKMLPYGLITGKSGIHLGFGIQGKGRRSKGSYESGKGLTRRDAVGEGSRKGGSVTEFHANRNIVD